MQHVVSGWQRLLNSDGPFTTDCGVRNWPGAGEHDPLCGECARINGLVPGSTANPVPKLGQKPQRRSLLDWLMS